MKRITIATLIALVAVSVALAQGTGTQQPQSQPGGTQQQPAGTQQQQQQQPGAAPGQAAPAAPAAPGAGHLPGTKAQPQPTTQEEYNAYVAVTQAPDIAAAEAAANDFATKFPNSNLRGALFHVMMMKYSQQNNGEKAIEMGRKAVQFDPDNPVVLALLASSIAETAREADLDFDQKAAEVVKLATHAIETADTSITVPPTVSAEQLASFRNKVKTLAHGAIGKVELQKANYSGAEQHLRKAIEIAKADGGRSPSDSAGDYLRLSIALDKQKRYPEALEAAKQAMTLAEAGSQAALLAKQQHDRLVKLTPGASTTSAPAGAAAPSTQPQSTQPQQQQPQKPQGTTPR